jgi:hypothetical protein
MLENKIKLEKLLSVKVKEKEQLQNHLFEVINHISKINGQFNERILSTQDQIRACSNSRPPGFDQSIAWPHVQSSECPYQYAEFFANKEMLEKNLWKELNHIKQKQREAVEMPEREKVQLEHQEQNLTNEIRMLNVKIKCCHKSSISILKLKKPKKYYHKPCPLSKKRKCQKPCPKSKKK